MNGKTFIILLASIALFTLAAKHRFLDSAHAIGTIKKGGGAARHPALLESGRDSYMLIATATVAPPYRGNARVVLEGDPTLTATFHNSEPAMDLDFHHHPAFRNNIYHDLRPMDRIGLWVNLQRTYQPGKSQAVPYPDPVKPGNTPPQCENCEPAGEVRTGTWGAAKGASLAFYDVKTDEALLRIPIRFSDGKGGDRNAH